MRRTFSRSLGTLELFHGCRKLVRIRRNSIGRANTKIRKGDVAVFLVKNFVQVPVCLECAIQCKARDSAPNMLLGTNLCQFPTKIPGLLPVRNVTARKRKQSRTEDLQRESSEIRFEPDHGVDLSTCFVGHDRFLG